MSGIAEVLINQDYEVSGSDPSSNRVTDYLKSLGADIRHNHSPENVTNKHVVVVSNAIKEDNVEVHAAKEKSIPVIPRAEMLAELMSCLLYTSPSPRDLSTSRMPSSA